MKVFFAAVLSCKTNEYILKLSHGRCQQDFSLHKSWEISLAVLCGSAVDFLFIILSTCMVVFSSLLLRYLSLNLKTAQYFVRILFTVDFSIDRSSPNAREDLPSLDKIITLLSKILFELIFIFD